jgi:hypothetical protein
LAGNRVVFFLLTKTRRSLVARWRADRSFSELWFMALEGVRDSAGLLDTTPI